MNNITHPSSLTTHVQQYKSATQQAVHSEQ